jgi:hypothetical protein
VYPLIVCFLERQSLCLGIKSHHALKLRAGVFLLAGLAAALPFLAGLAVNNAVLLQIVRVFYLHLLPLV